MKTVKLVLLLAGTFAGATAMQAGIPFKLVRERFANGEAIKLDLQAQEQTRNGDLANAERTVALAYKKIRHYG